MFCFLFFLRFLLYPWASTPVPPVSVSVRRFFLNWASFFFFFLGGGSWAVVMSHLVLCTIQMFLEAGFIFNNSLSSWLTTFLSNCSHGLWSPFLTDADLICFSDSTVLPFPFPSELSALSFCFFLYTQQNQIPQTWLALPCKGEFFVTHRFSTGCLVHGPNPWWRAGHNTTLHLKLPVIYLMANVTVVLCFLSLNIKLVCSLSKGVKLCGFTHSSKYCAE